MEIMKLIKCDIKELYKDKEAFVKVQNTLRELLLYCAKYGIAIDNIIDHEDISLEICITVPEHSELKSEREFEMCGIYLANQFKTKIMETIENLYKVSAKSSKIPRIKIKYTSVIGSKISEEESNDKIADIKCNINTNVYYPFTDDEVYGAEFKDEVNKIVDLILKP